MCPYVAGAVRFARMPKHVNQGMQLPPVGVTEGGSQAVGIQAGQQFDGLPELQKLPRFTGADGCVQYIGSRLEQLRRSFRGIAGFAPVASKEEDIQARVCAPRIVAPALPLHPTPDHQRAASLAPATELSSVSFSSSQALSSSASSAKPLDIGLAVEIAAFHEGEKVRTGVGIPGEILHEPHPQIGKLPAHAGQEPQKGAAPAF